jgi:hypothetical protein
VDIRVTADPALPAGAVAAVHTLQFVVSGADTAQVNRSPLELATHGEDRIVYSTTAGSGTLDLTVAGYTYGGARFLVGDSSVTLSGGTVSTRVVLAADRTRPPAQLSLAPSLHDFGALQPTTMPFDFEITNIGGQLSAPLTTRIDGNGSFAISNDGCGGQDLPPMASCKVAVAFNPASYGPVGGTLYVGSSDGSDQSASVQGVNPDPNTLAVAPQTLQFGSVAVGQSAEYSFQASVLTAASTTITARLSGDPDFVIVNDQCKGAQFPSNGSCVVVVRFQPTSTGNKQAILEALPGIMQIEMGASQLFGVGTQ